MASFTRRRHDVSDPSVSPVFVQFPHPGEEHSPGKALRQAWNTSEHRRKFLRSNGALCRRRRFDLGEATLVFWGEWETPLLHRRTSGLRAGSLPRFLHEPVWEYPKNSDPRQNTDPWVFGDCFRYSNCKQQRQAALQKLARGSLILFGSTRDGNFVVDTVFVVRDSERYRPAQPPEGDDAFRICTIQSLLTDAGCSGGRVYLVPGSDVRCSGQRHVLVRAVP